MKNEDKNKKLFLISSSIIYGKGYLDHVIDDLVDFLGETNEILFIPFARTDHEEYSSVVAKRFFEIGIKVESLHTSTNYKDSVKNAKTIFIGGGNTFRLLNTLQQYNLISVIRQRIKEGLPYIGSSAGSNLAAPTIKTTNDMPIVSPSDLEALNLIPFQINPHYVDLNPNSKHMGESRAQRIKEFHEENSAPVLGLKEGSWLRVEKGKIYLKGSEGAKLFIKNKEPINYLTEADLTFLWD